MISSREAPSTPSTSAAMNPVRLRWCQIRQKMASEWLSVGSLQQQPYTIATYSFPVTHPNISG